MDSRMISQVHKARQYAEQPSLFSFKQFAVSFEGNNHSHTVGFDGGTWKCDCESFEHQECCSHVMAVERLLENMRVNLAS